jgi:hypothetical protein
VQSWRLTHPTDFTQIVQSGHCRHAASSPGAGESQTSTHEAVKLMPTPHPKPKPHRPPQFHPLGKAMAGNKGWWTSYAGKHRKAWPCSRFRPKSL